MTSPDTAKALAELGTKLLDTLGDPIKEVIGFFGGDWLRTKREINREHLKARKEQILNERKITMRDEVSPSIGVPLLLEAQDESREELRDLWARLLAAIEDPQRSGLFRQKFVQVIKQFDPVDAQVLKGMFEGQFQLSAIHVTGARNSYESYAQRLNISRVELEVSLEHLKELGCVVEFGGSGFGISPFGKLLMSILV